MLLKVLKYKIFPFFLWFSLLVMVSFICYVNYEHEFYFLYYAVLV